MEKALPAIPAKRYFTIGEVSDLCGVKPYVLRYWEQEFTQLKPMKRRGNRRYYQHHEVLLIRRIRDLLYEQGFTISGARNRLSDHAALSSDARRLQERVERFQTAVLEPLKQRTVATLAAYRANQASLVMLFEARHAEVEVQRKLLNLQRDLAKTQAQLVFKPISQGAAQ